MATSDLTFILIFIVLPTAVIVSGFWAILFVRRRPARTPGRGRRRRGRDRPAAGEEPATVAAQAAGDEEPGSTTSAVAPGSAHTLGSTGVGNTAPSIDESAAAEHESARDRGEPDEPTAEDTALVQSTTEIPAVEVDTDEQADHQRHDSTPTSTEPATESAAADPSEAEIRDGADEDHPDWPADRDVAVGPGPAGEKPETAELEEPSGESREAEPEREAGRDRYGRRRRPVPRRKPGEGPAPKASRRSRSTERQVPRLGRRSGRRDQG